MNRKTLLGIILIYFLLVTTCCLKREATSIIAPGGLVIKKLDIYPSKKASSGEIVTVDAEIENVGDAKATDIEAEIINLGPFICNDPRKDIEDLNPPNPEYNVPGGSAYESWDITMPVVDQEYTHTIKLQIKYKYETYAHAQIPVVTKERWKKLNRIGKPIVVSEYCSKAPVIAKFSGASPIILKDFSKFDKFTNTNTISFDSEPIILKATDPNCRLNVYCYSKAGGATIYTNQCSATVRKMPGVIIPKYHIDCDGAEYEWPDDNGTTIQCTIISISTMAVLELEHSSYNCLGGISIGSSEKFNATIGPSQPPSPPPSPPPAPPPAPGARKIVMVVENIGGGYVENNNVDLEVTCSGAGSCRALSSSIKLIGNKGVADIEITPDLNGKEEDTIFLKATLKYTYVLEKPITITVIPPT